MSGQRGLKYKHTSIKSSSCKAQACQSGTVGAVNDNVDYLSIALTRPYGEEQSLTLQGRPARASIIGVHALQTVGTGVLSGKG